MVHSREIEPLAKGVGLDVFDRVLQDLGRWQRLRTAGVHNFVITSDHGTSNEGAPPAVRRHGNKPPSRRHVFHRPHAAGEQLMMPKDTAVFDTGKHDMRFVHGGNSLQERLIPVLTLQHKGATGGSSQQFQIEAHWRQGVAGLHCLEIQVRKVEQLGLDFGNRNRIELALKCPDDPDLQVELAQARGGAQLNGSVIQAPVGEAFELFFRLRAATRKRCAWVATPAPPIKWLRVSPTRASL